MSCSTTAPGAKLDVLKSEIAEADKLDKEATPLDVKKYLGKVPLVPSVKESLPGTPNLDEDGEFNYNNLLNPNTTGSATGNAGPTGIRGFASEKDASNAYDEKDA